jgi:hypothetical protein
MNTRIRLLLTAGLFAVCVTQGAIWLTRPLTPEEERSVDHHCWVAEQRASFKSAIAETADQDRKRLYEYEYRIFDHVIVGRTLVSLVSLEDGVDQFEAFVIARSYLARTFGACADVYLPRRIAGEWVSEIAVGRHGPQMPPIRVDGSTGRITCEGYESINDVMLFLKSHERPNKSLQPTPTGVRPPAAQDITSTRGVAEH